MMMKKRNNKPDRSRPGSTTTTRPIGSLQDGCDKHATGATSIKLPTTGTTIGTWNVRTLHACGKIYELTHEISRYHCDVIGLCEVRWRGFGETSTDEGHRLWYSGDEKRHILGVGFIVRKEVVSSVVSCTPVSSRMISIRISAKPHNVTIIQVYAPSTDHDDEEVEEFYELLENHIKTVPKKDILMIQGDWNAKVGPDAYIDWRGAVGKFGAGTTNDRGLGLLEFAKSYNLTLANTLHPHKHSRTVTWHSPDGHTHNQIDYILVQRRFKSSINKAKTRTFPGADVGSDHDLVLATFKLKLKAKRDIKSPRISFDLEKLKDPDIASSFQAQVGGKFAALNLLDKDVDTFANYTKEVLLSAAQDVLGKKKKKNQHWVTNEVLDLCDERRKLKGVRHTSDDARAQYRTVHNTVRKKTKEANQKWLDDQCSAIDTNMARGNTRSAYKTIKIITKSSEQRASVINDKDDNLLTEGDNILERWTEYCECLYNNPINPVLSVLHDIPTPRDTTESPPILKAEVEAAVRSLKPEKSPGLDNVPAELLKHGDDTTVDVLTALCQKIWEQKKWPVEWTQSLVIPLPKKGNLRQCNNYRTISLISHPSKIMLRIILNRLRPQAEEVLSEEQAGFRAGRCTVEQILNCRLMIEKHLQHQRDLFHDKAVSSLP